MFHVKHSAFSCFLPLFFGFLLSCVSPFVFRFFLPLCSSRCFSLLFTLFWGHFFAFCASRVNFGRIFLDLEMAFCPFFFFSCFFFYFFRNFCVFGLLYRFCRADWWFSLRLFVFSLCFSLRFALFFRFLLLSGDFRRSFSLFLFFVLFSCFRCFAFSFLCSFWGVFCLFALLG